VAPTPTPNPDPAPVVTLKGGGVYLTRQWAGSGNFLDVSVAGKTFTAVVYYGDGSGAMPLTLNGHHFVLQHVYPDTTLAHTYTVTVVVTDSNGVSGHASMSVTII